MPTSISARYEQVVDWLQSRFAGASERPDLPALALVLVASISASHSLRRTFGRTPDNVDDERFIAAWTEAALVVARRHGIDERDRCSAATSSTAARRSVRLRVEHAPTE